MFGVGDTVLYGTAGVCRVAEIEPRTVDKKKILYYVLKPVFDSRSTIYCPVDNDRVRFQKVISRAEVGALIRAIPDLPDEWVDDEQLRKEKFSEILKHGSHAELIALLHTLRCKREERHRAGKRPHAADERLLREAETILHSEFAFVLGIRPEEVTPFIEEELHRIGAAG